MLEVITWLAVATAYMLMVANFWLKTTGVPRKDDAHYSSTLLHVREVALVTILAQLTQGGLLPVAFPIRTQLL